MKLWQSPTKTKQADQVTLVTNSEQPHVETKNELAPWQNHKLLVRSEQQAEQHRVFATNDERLSSTSVYANIGSRTAAYLIDWALLSVIGGLITVLLLYIGSLCYPVDFKECRPDAFQFVFYFGTFWFAGLSILKFPALAVPIIIGSRIPIMPLYLAFAIAFFYGPFLLDALYHAICESSAQRATFGQRLMGIYVANESNEQLTFRKCFVRHLYQVIVSMLPPVEYGWMFFNLKRQTLHDALAKTVVLNKPNSMVSRLLGMK